MNHHDTPEEISPSDPSQLLTDCGHERVYVRYERPYNGESAAVVVHFELVDNFHRDPTRCPRCDEPRGFHICI